MKTLSLSTLAVVLGTQWANAADLPIVTVTDHLLNVQDKCLEETWATPECAQAVARSNVKMSYDYFNTLLKSGFETGALEVAAACSQNIDDWKQNFYEPEKPSAFPETCEATTAFWSSVSGFTPNQLQHDIMSKTNILLGAEYTSTHNITEAHLDTFAQYNY